jgi:hypothetical protein
MTYDSSLTSPVIESSPILLEANLCSSLERSTTSDSPIISPVIHTLPSSQEALQVESIPSTMPMSTIEHTSSSITTPIIPIKKKHAKVPKSNFATKKLPTTHSIGNKGPNMLWTLAGAVVAFLLAAIALRNHVKKHDRQHHKVIFSTSSYFLSPNLK